MKRRSFLLAALSTAPLAACGPAVPADPISRPRSTGVLVRAGRDRLDRSRTVLGGLRIDAKVLPEDSAGGLYVVEHADESKGGPPRHVHHEQDEWFYVREGAYVLEVGEERFELGPGDSVFAPRGVPHVWAHISDGVGRLLLAFQPAGLMEPFFAALEKAGSAPSPDALRPLFDAHGMSVVGPPLPV